jgi:predicted metal-dependent hydrolase
MEEKHFDPFADRQARLLRNALAGSLVAALRTGNAEPFRQKGRELLSRTTDPVHRAYLVDRLQRYVEAFGVIEGQRLVENFAQALILWNFRLFYEVHELLEHLWRQSSGPLRGALQAMIRAAGVYVHLEAGNRRAARSMAAKAAAGLCANGEALPPFVGKEQLLTALADLDLAPPVLRQEGTGS